MNENLLEKLISFVIFVEAYSHEDVKALISEFPTCVYEGTAYRFLFTDKESEFSENFVNLSWTLSGDIEFGKQLKTGFNDMKYIDIYSSSVVGINLYQLSFILKEYYLENPCHLPYFQKFLRYIESEDEILVVSYTSPQFISRHTNIE